MTNEHPPPRPASRRLQAYADQAALYGRGITPEWLTGLLSASTTETVQQAARTAQQKTAMHKTLENIRETALPLPCDGDDDPWPEPKPDQELMINTLHRLIGVMEGVRDRGSDRAKTLGEQALFQSGCNQAISRMAEVVFLALRDQ